MWGKMSPFFKVVIYFLGIPLSPVVKWDYEILRYKFWWIPLVISLDQKHVMPIGISTQEAKKILKIIDQEICDCKPLLWLAHFIRRKRQENRNDYIVHIMSENGLNMIDLVLTHLDHFWGPTWWFDALISVPVIHFSRFRHAWKWPFLGKLVIGNPAA